MSPFRYRQKVNYSMPYPDDGMQTVQMAPHQETPPGVPSHVQIIERTERAKALWSSRLAAEFLCSGFGALYPCRNA